jgi:hypothetical protein
MSIPRRSTTRMTEVLWALEDLRHPPPAKRRSRLLRRPYFRDALDLLRLDLMARGADMEPVEWWLRAAEEEGLVVGGEVHGPDPGAPRGGRRRRGRRGGRRRGAGRGPPPEADAWAPPPGDDAGRRQG